MNLNSDRDKDTFSNGKSGRGRRRLRKSYWQPAVLLLYFAIICIIYGRDLIAGGHTTRFMATVAIEITIVVLLFLSLRRKEKLRREREEADENLRK